MKSYEGQFFKIILDDNRWVITENIVIALSYYYEDNAIITDAVTDRIILVKKH